MDALLHAERLDGKVKRLHALRVPMLSLPNGAMITSGGKSYLIANGETWLWSFAGYRRVETELSDAKLLTPPSIVRALRAGYSAQIALDDQAAFGILAMRPATARTLRGAAIQIETADSALTAMPIKKATV